MVRRAKTPKFEDYRTNINCFDFKDQRMDFAGYLNNQGPYNVELGCGSASLSLELARRYPNRVFIAIDIKSDRMWRGANTALYEGVQNIAFVRANIKDINQIFGPKSCHQIWLTFPDPYPKKGNERRRLTHSDYLQIYSSLLIIGGEIKFKTDNKPLFDWSLTQFNQQINLKLVEKSYDLHKDYSVLSDEAIKTFYEEQFLSNNLLINYAKYQLKS